MNISFVAGSLGQGGAERQLVYLIQTLNSLEIRTEVLSITKGGFWEKFIVSLGTPVIWVGRHKSKIFRLFDIYNSLKRNPPEYIHSSHFFTNLYASITANLIKSRDIGSLRSNVFSEIKNTGFLGRACLFTPNLIVANSKAAIRNAIELGRKKDDLFYLPNVVDTKVFIPKQKYIPEKSLNIIFVGTLSAPKRIDRLLRIIYRCKQENLNLNVKIYGDGILFNKLVTYASNLGLSNQYVTFMGRSSDMSTIYRQSDVLILTSDYEGTPNVILEAMASGLPVISTNVGGIQEVINNEFTGFIIERESENEFVEKIKRFYYERELIETMGKNARGYVENNHSLTILPCRLNELYHF